MAAVTDQLFAHLSIEPSYQDSSHTLTWSGSPFNSNFKYRSVPRIHSLMMGIFLHIQHSYFDCFVFFACFLGELSIPQEVRSDNGDCEGDGKGPVDPEEGGDVRSARSAGLPVEECHAEEGLERHVRKVQ